MYKRSSNRIFAGKGTIGIYFTSKLKEIKSEINTTSESYILNVSEEQYSEYLVNKYKINPPLIHFDRVYAEDTEKNIRAEAFPITFHVEKGKSYPRKVIYFLVPLSGDYELLKYMPRTTGVITIGGGSSDFKVEIGELKLEVVDLYNDPKKIKAIYDNNVQFVEKEMCKLERNIQEFNNSLYDRVIKKVRKRKNKFLEKNEYMSALGVPFKKNTDVPTTFSIPKPNLRTKIKVSKPTADNKIFKPEPTIDIEVYNQILKLINDVGKNFERLPSVYNGKGEEDLRDYILMTLDPNFEYGSVSGETFNKTGKTDIQIRYESSVVFIAECKFWNGEKGLLKAISQLLNYLTWRDTKTAVIIFVKQQNFTTILSKAKAITATHSNFLGFVSTSDENWFNYRFHLNEDKNREVKLALQLFHLPQTR